jgi:hypothetical protein
MCRRYVICQPEQVPLLTFTDLQDRPLQGFRSQVHNTRDRKHRRAAPALPSRLVAGTGTQSQTQNRPSPIEPQRRTNRTRLLPKCEHERMNLMKLAREECMVWRLEQMCATYGWTKRRSFHFGRRRKAATWGIARAGALYNAFRGQGFEM